MSDAIRTLLLLALGYAAGAAHLFFAQSRREGSAYMAGYRDGQRVSGRGRA